MSRLEVWSIVCASVVLLVVPVPFFLAGEPRVVFFTDPIGFGLLFLVVGRGGWRAWRMRQRALEAQAEAEAAQRRLRRTLEYLLRRRGERGPLS